MTNLVLQSWQLLLVTIAGAVNQEQQRAIEYVRTENQILKEKLSKKRIVLNDDQRRRLAVNAANGTLEYQLISCSAWFVHLS